MALGDLNCSVDRVEKHLQSRGEGLRRYRVRGSMWSCFPLKGVPACLDHILMSRDAESSFIKPRVERRWALSDHRPLITAMRVHTPAPSGSPVEMVRYDRKVLAIKSFELVNDNRWLPLLGLEEESVEKLSVSTDALT